MCAMPMSAALALACGLCTVSCSGGGRAVREEPATPTPTAPARPPSTPAQKQEQEQKPAPRHAPQRSPASPPERLRGVVQLASSDGRSCAVLGSGRVACWGRVLAAVPGASRMPVGGKTFHSRPVLIPGLTDAASVWLSRRLSCVIRRSGEVMCWGHGMRLRIAALPPSAGPRAVPALNWARQLSMTDVYICGVTGSGAVRCLGTGSPPRVPSVPGIEEVSLSIGQVCVRRGGDVLCWKRDTLRFARKKVAVPPPLITGAVSLSAQGVKTCAVLRAGKMSCWTDSEPRPRPEQGIADAVEHGFGHGSRCIRTRGGRVQCWGSNRFGQLGRSGGAPRAGDAADVSALDGVRQLAMGRYHACALTAGGEAACWGKGLSGELGNAPLPRSRQPLRVKVAPAVRIWAGSDQTCALVRGGAVVCWGENGRGELGRATAGDVSGPVTIPGLRAVKGMALGARHGCALERGGKVTCWGSGDRGQLGRPCKGRCARGPVHGLGAVAGVAAAGDHSYAWSPAGEVYRWGAHVVIHRMVSSGRNLGAGLGPALDVTCARRRDPGCRTQPLHVPVREQGVVAREVAPGPEHACAVNASGEVICWGKPDGRGRGAPRRPRKVQGVAGAAGLCSTHGATCALLRSGEVVCLDAALRARPVPRLADATQLVCGGQFACARRRAGRARCWPQGAYRRPRHDIPRERLQPLAPRLADVAEVAAGDAHACVRTVGGEVHCWGDNSRGQLGTGGGSWAMRPVPVLGFRPEPGRKMR